MRISWFLISSPCDQGSGTGTRVLNCSLNYTRAWVTQHLNSYNLLLYDLLFLALELIDEHMNAETEYGLKVKPVLCYFNWSLLDAFYIVLFYLLRDVILKWFAMKVQVISMLLMPMHYYGV